MGIIQQVAEKEALKRQEEGLALARQRELENQIAVIQNPQQPTIDQGLAGKYAVTAGQLGLPTLPIGGIRG